MLQQLIIGLAVLVAAGYVSWSFMTMGARQTLLDTLAARGVLVQAAANHRKRLAMPGCSNCASSKEHGAQHGKGKR